MRLAQAVRTAGWEIRAAWSERVSWIVEVWSGLIACAWALHVLLTPGRLDARPGYYTLAWLPDEVWIGLGLIGGSLQVIAARRGHPAARRLVALGLCGFYLLLADGLRSAAPLTPSCIFPLGLAAMNVPSFFRARAPRRPA